MPKILIFGNSGSGKSTLARKYATRLGLDHLDLDTLAWQDTDPPTRKPLAGSEIEIKRFVAGKTNWVIEGCYADLLGLIISEATEVIFLNPGIGICIDNARRRPWEPHKYKTQKEQNENLGMLIAWIEQYDVRKDEFSLSAHRQLFGGFTGRKKEYFSNDRDPV